MRIDLRKGAAGAAGCDLAESSPSGLSLDRFSLAERLGLASSRAIRRVTLGVGLKSSWSPELVWPRRLAACPSDPRLSQIILLGLHLITFLVRPARCIIDSS